MLSPLPVVEPPEGLFAVDDIEPYGSVAEFVEEYICKVYRRQVTDSVDVVWCPEWWRHAEAGARMLGLWESWYFKRNQGAVGISEWFIDHADPQMRILFSPKGPFRFCSVRNGHSNYLTEHPLPMLRPPAEFMSDPGDAELEGAQGFGR
ncbi:DUF4913 domain-containing protein [Nocardia stercoris]|uniref:DUF4913 domain-containing protein n=2 Tax=Nocardia stercoris TaxID=2483361 RepID=A0A3M2KZI0_9NOCA|nr:DUF4913 domain-containing protein [Nocardia stercoris]